MGQKKCWQKAQWQDKTMTENERSLQLTVQRSCSFNKPTCSYSDQIHKVHPPPLPFLHTHTHTHTHARTRSCACTHTETQPTRTHKNAHTISLFLSISLFPSLSLAVFGKCMQEVQTQSLSFHSLPDTAVVLLYFISQSARHCCGPALLHFTVCQTLLWSCSTSFHSLPDTAVVLLYFLVPLQLHHQTGIRLQTMTIMNLYLHCVATTTQTMAIMNLDLHCVATTTTWTLSVLRCLDWETNQS